MIQKYSEVKGDSLSTDPANIRHESDRMAPKEERLKCLPEYFQQTWDGNKLFEIRLNDRDFHVGDTVILNEWTGRGYTGRQIIDEITSVIDYPAGLKDGYVVLGLDAEMLERKGTDVRMPSDGA